MGRYSGKRMLVVGLGLSGVSALRYLAREDADLVITDSRAEPAGHQQLTAEFGRFEFRLGGFAAPEPLNQFSEAVVSPGVSLNEPFVQALRAAGVPIIGDIELFARHAKVPVIGITGSNGKSTVTTLVGEMAKAAGLKVGVGGNLAPPALDVLSDSAQLYVLELSSFQLETTHTLRCRAAAVLNLSEDHLDRHGSMAAYGAAKARIFNGCQVAVVNRDDVATRLNSDAARRRLSFGLDAPRAPGEYGLIEQRGELWLATARDRILPLSALKIAGLHNAANVLAALALIEAADIPRATVLRALQDFRGLPHRCAFVAEIDGARYYNDSKGTNVGSTLAAVRGLPSPLIWLGGGQGKGQDFSPLAGALAAKGSAAVLFGEDADKIEAAIDGALPVYREASMADALRRARTLTLPGASVLLSPACASFDQFKSYVDRGQQFEAAVRELAAGGRP
ncbi:UDP-N-acetylmuramoyl-L-alanine--D-glutamate ligase [Stagnimonas aquatica]|uniref:UDP-N-acetylmuramoylalanine--D-glutamate ligase n=1 Tax=Stagnimonas aquatica TaxID=2689987 RepID=A0A3N0VKY0_9GAMM|nr:UDP-N-acetylmuramoyl-L-alanine--D-glutamate ligase [Stagnimonas aquatica]ROH93423.1 UDP-N-acetylmuramoyl-L-alanine--D-glutamate ligase [Stagnimonas aquatica]